MYPVSAKWAPGLAAGVVHPVWQVQLVRPTGEVEELETLADGGSVTVDRGSKPRYTCSVSIPDPALIPRSETDKLATYGARLRVFVGIDYGDGTTPETVPCGVYRLDSVDGDVDDGPVTLQGSGLEAVLDDDTFTAPVSTRGFETAFDAATMLIRMSMPDAVINTTGATNAAISVRTWDVGTSTWDAVTEVAQAIGCEAYADAAGQFVIAPLPDIDTAQPVWTVAAGEGGTYISQSRGMTIDGVYNGVLATSENTESTTAPVSALVVDNTPGSPTLWGGPFGRRPKSISSPLWTTLGSVQSAAQFELAAAVKPNASASVASLPNPALAAGDVFRVVDVDGHAELHQAQSFSIPLSVAADFTITTIGTREGT